MPLPLTVSCFSKIQIGFTFLVLAHPGSAGTQSRQMGACVCVFQPGASRLEHSPSVSSSICSSRAPLGMRGTDNFMCLRFQSTNFYSGPSNISNFRNHRRRGKVYQSSKIIIKITIVQYKRRKTHKKLQGTLLESIRN